MGLRKVDQAIRAALKQRAELQDELFVKRMKAKFPAVFERHSDRKLPTLAEKLQRARQARASELRAAMKPKGVTSILKATGKGRNKEIGYTTGRLLKVKQGSWTHIEEEKAKFVRVGRTDEWTTELIAHEEWDSVEAVKQFAVPPVFGWEPMGYPHDEEIEEERLKEKLEDSIVEAEAENQRLTEEVMAKKKSKVQERIDSLPEKFTIEEPITGVKVQTETTVTKMTVAELLRRRHKAAHHTD